MQAKKLNKLPDGFKHPFEDVKASGKKLVVFRLLNLKKSNDPDPEINGRLLMPGITHITPYSRLVIDSELYHIGAPENIDDNGEVIEWNIRCQFTEAKKGMLALSMDNPAHIELIKWMLLTPRNSKSPFANQDRKGLIFETVNFNIDAKDKVDLTEMKADAIMALKQMSEEALRDAYAVVFQKLSSDLGIHQVKAALQVKAQEIPEKIIKLVAKKEVNLEALAREAKELKIIKLDQAGKCFRFVKSDDILFAYEGQGSPYGKLAEFLANNKEVVTKIEAMIEVVKEV